MSIILITILQHEFLKRKSNFHLLKKSLAFFKKKNITITPSPMVVVYLYFIDYINDRKNKLFM